MRSCCMHFSYKQLSRGHTVYHFHGGGEKISKNRARNDHLQYLFYEIIIVSTKWNVYYFPTIFIGTHGIYIVKAMRNVWIMFMYIDLLCFAFILHEDWCPWTIFLQETLSFQLCHVSSKFKVTLRPVITNLCVMTDLYSIVENIKARSDITTTRGCRQWTTVYIRKKVEQFWWDITYR